MLRRCPVCERDSIVGHGRRRKQAHDEHHDWIGNRRGFCRSCGKTFTFLPWFSLPYTRYSLPAHRQALRRRFVEQRSWEGAVPTLKDPDRAPDPSTLRRWSRGLDPSQPALSFLRRTLASLAHWLGYGDLADFEAGPLSGVAPALQILWPLRLYDSWGAATGDWKLSIFVLLNAALQIAAIRGAVPCAAQYNRNHTIGFPCRARTYSRKWLNGVAR
jgi:hypothetical protein